MTRRDRDEVIRDTVVAAVVVAVLLGIVAACIALLAAVSS